MLIYSASCESKEKARITGMWYYSEIFVPRTSAEKKSSILDFKKKRCLFLDVQGSFRQIGDLLMQSDKFQKGSELEIRQLAKLMDQLEVSGHKPILFDDVNNVCGTALSLDTVCAVEETEEDVITQINSPKKMVFVTISKQWSWVGDIYRAISDR